MSYLEEEHRGQIPALNRDPGYVQKEIDRLYPGYELIFRGDGKEWVLYKRKANLMMFLQFVLPGPPGMWLLDYMRERDRGNEDFQTWLKRQINRQEYKQEEKNQRFLNVKAELIKDKQAYLDRGRGTLHVNRHGK